MTIVPTSSFPFDFGDISTPSIVADDNLFDLDNADEAYPL
jgi:hypothetical protein